MTFTPVFLECCNSLNFLQTQDIFTFKLYLYILNIVISSASNSATPKRFNSAPRESELQMAVMTTESITAQAICEEIEFLKAQIAKLTRDQTKVQDLLSSLGFALRSFNNVNQFLELTPLMSSRVVDAEGGALVLFKEDEQGSETFHLEKIHCAENRDCAVIRQAFDQLQLHFSKVASPESKVGNSTDSHRFDDQLQSFLGSEIRIYGTPILLKNTERGKLYVFSRDPHYDWDITRRKLVQLIADQTAVAIANHDLKIKVHQKEKQDRELEIASEIQNHLLPRECPQIHGLAIAAECRNAYRVGGDYYDFIPTNYDRIRRQDDPKLIQCVPWSIVIGDVMGKGVPAGLIMTMTRGMLRAEVLNRHSPAKILQHLNRVMYADLDNSHRFVTLFYSEYDPVTRILSYSNAAHHPPLLWRAKDQTIQKLDTKGMLVGLDLDSEYEDGQVTLEIGDIVLYFTDGFTDAANAQGDRFDEDNLTTSFQNACQSCKTPNEIVQTLFSKVEQFTSPQILSGDDMTLVVVQVQSDAVDSQNCE